MMNNLENKIEQLEFENKKLRQILQKAEIPLMLTQAEIERQIIELKELQEYFHKRWVNREDDDGSPSGGCYDNDNISDEILHLIETLQGVMFNTDFTEKYKELKIGRAHV